MNVAKITKSYHEDHGHNDHHTVSLRQLSFLLLMIHGIFERVLPPVNSAIWLIYLERTLKRI